MTPVAKGKEEQKLSARLFSLQKFQIRKNFFTFAEVFEGGPASYMDMRANNEDFQQKGVVIDEGLRNHWDRHVFKSVFVEDQTHLQHGNAFLNMENKEFRN